MIKTIGELKKAIANMDGNMRIDVVDMSGEFVSNLEVGTPYTDVEKPYVEFLLPFYITDYYKDTDLFFNKDWENIETSVEYKGINYYIDCFPFDTRENDNMSIRVYKDKEMTEKHECGNGLWCDSSFCWVDGNDQLYFSDDEEENQAIETLVLNKVKEELTMKGII